MDQRSVVFPAALALGLTDAPDEDDVMWEDFFEEAQLHAGHDDTADNGGTTVKGRRGGWRRSFKRTPHASKKYEQNRYEYKESPWWKNFVVFSYSEGVPSPRVAKEFQQCFNVPFKVYGVLLQRSQEPDSPFKDTYAPGEKKGPPRTPVALKIMVVLFCLKENVSFHGAIQAGQIGDSTARTFFHKWIEWIVRTMYDEYVHPPETPHQISSTMAKFDRLGLPGCITLFDAVHIWWDMCPTALAPLHKGKDGRTTRTFNFASDCNRRIHHVHGSDVGARNDKTLP